MDKHPVGSEQRCDVCGEWFVSLSYFHLKCDKCSIPQNVEEPK